MPINLDFAMFTLEIKFKSAVDTLTIHIIVIQTIIKLLFKSIREKHSKFRLQNLMALIFVVQKYSISKKYVEAINKDCDL